MHRKRGVKSRLSVTGHQWPWWKFFIGHVSYPAGVDNHDQPQQMNVNAAIISSFQQFTVIRD